VIASSPLLTANGLPDAEIVATHPPFEDVYALHVAAVYRFCLSQVRDPCAAEDATAEVFTAALKAYDRVRPGAGVRFWLFRIARNTVVSHHRRRARQSDLSRLIGESRPTGDDVQLTAEVREELREVAAVVATMRRRDRTLIGLRLAAQLTHEEIGAVLGMNEAAAKMATHRALKALRERLEKRT
jgi:RNA polymerase sigma-70 factor (ECF subfamily)